MRLRSLNQEIFRLVVGLVLLTSVTILVNVWWTTYGQAQQRMLKDIEIAEQVLTNTIDNREALLYTSASVLTEDFGFRQAIATRDQATIVSALNNHGQRINADLMAIVNLNGELIAQTLQSSNALNAFAKNDSDLALPITAAQIKETIETGGTSSFSLVDKRLFKTNLLRIDAPRPIALGLVGFELDKSFIEGLGNITNLDVEILVVQSNALDIRISSNAERTMRTISLDDLTLYDLIFDSHATVSQQISLYDDNELEVSIVLTQELATLIAEFSSLKTSISFIIAIASIFAFVIAALYSQKLTKPLTYFVSLAQSIASGDYQKDIRQSSNSRELHDLADAFATMQISISEREKQISYHAQHDPLTDLYTRYYIGESVNKMLNEGLHFQAIGINVVGFRSINDVFGYQYGDVCLSVLAHRISKLGGLAARLTGGEFLWLPAQMQNDHQIALIKSELEQVIQKDDVSIPISLSVGYVCCPDQANNALELLKRINIVLDQAKLSPSRLMHYSHELEEKYERRLQIFTKLKKAIISDSDNLSMVYQPKLHIREQRVSSVEALMRWTDPKLGFIPPDEFIAIAEQSGLISAVTYWVIDRVIADAALMHEQNLNVCIAVNLSARDLEDPLLLNKIKVGLEKVKLPASALSFEITEGDLVEDAKTAVEHLQAYRKQGHKLAIDDFGTGYSSLGYLKSFPVDTLKIDKSFVLELSNNKDDQDIVQTVMQLANKFNLSVVAEGVEDKEALQYLADNGCTWAQGYYICRPIPLNDLIKWCSEEEQTVWLSE